MKQSISRLLGLGVFAVLFSGALWGQSDAAFFDNTVLQEVRLTVDPGDWATLRADYMYDTYYGADFTWNGTTVANVGIKSRGSGSRSPKKPNLLVKFGKNVKNQRFLGHSAVVLKANNQDGSMMREFLTFRLQQYLGMPTPREAFARVYVNDEYFGLYTLVEDPDEEYIGRLFNDSTGYLYEFNAVQGYDFGYLGTAPDPYVPMFDPKTNSDTPAIDQIATMIAAVNLTPDPNFQAVVQPLLDLQSLMPLLAVEDYMGDEDGILSDVFTLNNFYLYRATNGQQFRFLPWDEDFSMLWSGRRVEQNLDTTVLTRRAYAIPALRQSYLDSMMQASTVAGASGGPIAQELERVYALIGDSARTDPNKQCIKNGGMTDCNADDFESEANEVRAFIADRYSNVRGQLAALPNSGTTQISAGGIVNAASNRDGLVPGSLMSIYGLSLAPEGAAADTVPLPNVLETAQVKVNGTAAPLLFASPLQINFQVPWSIGTGDTTVELFVGGVRKDVQQVQAQRSAPGVFLATHADYSLIDGNHPVRAGETLILYATGLGPVTVPPLAGQPAPLDQLSWTIDPVTATVNGGDAEVVFAGLAPGMIGVYQVNVVMPAVWTSTGDFAYISLHEGKADTSGSPDLVVLRH